MIPSYAENYTLTLERTLVALVKQLGGRVEINDIFLHDVAFVNSHLHIRRYEKNFSRIIATTRDLPDDFELKGECG